MLDLSADQVQQLLVSVGQPVFRRRQLEKWIYKGLVFDFQRMTDLPLALRQFLSERAVVIPLSPLADLRSADGTTRKTLFGLRDSHTIEAVLMGGDATTPVGGRTTVCVSTQAGCAIRCAFCATGRGGFVRHLTPGEIVGQVLYFAAQAGRITNVVFMGQGEPLLNFDAVWKAVEVLNSPAALGIAARHLTISTAGIVPGIRRLAEKKLQVGLAVSLHASNDAVRNSLVPLNRRYPMGELLSACWEYADKTGRRVTFEYVLIRGLNDGLQHARELGALLKGRLAHVNLIPLNPVENLSLQPATGERIAAFQAELQRHGIACTLRVERGQDILAACGQLRPDRLVTAR